MTNNQKENILKKLNNSSSFELELKKMVELKEDVSYTVENIKRITAKYGPSLIATLSIVDDDDDRFKVFLPNRYVNILNDSDIEHITGFKYLGGKFHNLEFY